MTTGVATPDWHRIILTPTLQKQCWGFMIGSFLFALGSAPGFGTWAGASTSNLCYFVGAWFFTTAALIQLLRSGHVTTKDPYGSGTMVRAEWLAAATQFAGTLMFNVSTASALDAHSMPAQKHFVWSPDAGGSAFFLISGFLLVLAFTHTDTFWKPSSRDWWSTQVNLIGCIAFGASAVGAYITTSGVTVDTAIANWGTFIGALCFLLASAVVVPRWNPALPAFRGLR